MAMSDVCDSTENIYIHNEQTQTHTIGDIVLLLLLLLSSMVVVARRRRRSPPLYISLISHTNTCFIFIRARTLIIIITIILRS